MSDIRAISRRLLAARRPLTVDDRTRTPAAVLLLLHDDGGAEHVLCQLRTHTVQHHKGEISLPGGRRDADDPSLLHTALRETQEEIGVAPEDIEVFGQLDDVPTRASNYVITPFVGAITAAGPYEFRTARREVAELLRVPLDHLRDDAAVRWSVLEVDGDRSAEREFHYGEQRIWGATARVLGQYIDLLDAADASPPPP